MTNFTKFYDIVDNKLGPLPSQNNGVLNVAVTRNAGAQPLHDELLACHKVNDEIGALLAELRKWAVEANLPIEDPPSPPTPIPGGGAQPPAVTPNDGVRRYFGPMYANTPYATEAGGDGTFEFSASGGNAYYFMTVDGITVIDGGMTAIQVKKGDQIVMMIRTPANGGNGNYTLTKYA